jgi:hypothetical protein
MDHEPEYDYDRRETGANKEKLLAVSISFAAVVLAAIGSSLAFLSDVESKFAVVDSHISSFQSDMSRIEKTIELMQTDIRQATAIHHALSERITRCEIGSGKK